MRYLDTIDSTVTPIDLSSGTYLVVTKNFNFGDNIKVVAREETPTLRKYIGLMITTL
jgi:hypothetical protein